MVRGDVVVEIASLAGAGRLSIIPDVGVEYLITAVHTQASADLWVYISNGAIEGRTIRGSSEYVSNIQIFITHDVYLAISNHSATAYVTGFSGVQWK